MKYLTLESFEELNASLSVINSGDFIIHGRIEAYSCKPTDSDKKLKQFIESKYPMTVEVSSSVESQTALDDISRKTLVYLLSTLNAAFPDYDFSEVKPAAFTKTTIINVRQHLTPLNQSVDIGYLLDSIDQVVNLEECSFYAFNPDKEIEPDAEEGNLWSFYFFFFNKKMKRIVFFTARAVSCLIQDINTELDVSRDSTSQSFDEFLMDQME